MLAEIEKSATEDTDFITSGNWNKTHIFKARNAFPNKSVDITDSTLLSSAKDKLTKHIDRKAFTYSDIKEIELFGLSLEMTLDDYRF